MNFEFPSFGFQILYNQNNVSDHAKRFILCTNPQESLINEAVEVISHELRRYPRVLMKANLTAINFVSDLKVRIRPDSNVYSSVSSTVDPTTGWLYIDVSYLESDKLYFKETVNHEIMHLYDYAVYGTFKPNRFQIPRWYNQNPFGFTYGSGGWTGYYNNSFENTLHPRPGFITSYAMLGIDEDRAEIFMYYWSKHLRDTLDAIVKEDSKLHEKLNLLLHDINE